MSEIPLRICGMCRLATLAFQDLEFADALAVVNSERAVCDEFRITRVLYDKGNPCFENAIPGSPSRNGNLAEWRASFVEDQCFRLQTADLQKLLILSLDIQGRGKSVSCCCFATARGGPCSRGWAMRKWTKLHKQTFFQRSDASLQTQGGHRSYMLDIFVYIYI